MAPAARYRVEEGRSCIDIHVRQSRQLFDFRDPAPFRERDLDDDAADYLLAAAAEIPRAQPLAIVVTISDEPEPRLAPEVIAEAVRAHFSYQRDHLQRRLREHLRRGQLFLAVGFSMLVAFLSLSQLALALSPGPVREILREGLMITGWVALWRPIEVLLYDWWPLVDDRRRLARIIDATVSVRYTAAPSVEKGA